jgi:prepilin-type N-terminal cleavage/methylation domain-containing protein
VRRAGFTLLEIVIVVGLIGLLTVALMPSFGGFSRGLDNAGDMLMADLRYTSQRAIATGRLHRWTIDLDEQLFRIEIREDLESEDDGELPTHADLLDLAPPAATFEYAPVANTTGDWRWLGEDGVLVELVSIGDDDYDEGLVSIAFAGDGGADPAAIELSDEHGYRMLVRVLAFTGEVRSQDLPEGP